VLIGILGGLTSFGLIGLFRGPAIMAALLTVWREWIGTADWADPDPALEKGSTVGRHQCGGVHPEYDRVVTANGSARSCDQVVIGRF
jgi:hypothetical protein